MASHHLFNAFREEVVERGGDDKCCNVEEEEHQDEADQDDDQLKDFVDDPEEPISNCPVPGGRIFDVEMPQKS